MHVLSNLAVSLDGKIATTSRVFFPLGTPYDRQMMQVIRKKADAILFGAATLRTFQKPCLVQRARRQPINVILSSSLEGISPKWPFFTRNGFRRVLLVGESAPASRMRLFEKTCEIHQLKKPTAKKPTAVQVIDCLASLGVKRLLVEGGGGVMWDFAQQNLIDEYYVTITPRIVGGSNAPTLVDGAGFEPRDVLNLKLMRCRRVGDELYLTYRKTAKRGP